MRKARETCMGTGLLKGLNVLPTNLDFLCK